MPYASPNDMIARYPNRDLVQLTNEDPTQTTINSATLQQALNDASAEIDGYLESRFSLPLNDPPASAQLRGVCGICVGWLAHRLAAARRRIRMTQVNRAI